MNELFNKVIVRGKARWRRHLPIIMHRTYLEFKSNCKFFLNYDKPRNVNIDWIFDNNGTIVNSCSWICLKIWNTKSLWTPEIQFRSNSDMQPTLLGWAQDCEMLWGTSMCIEQDIIVIWGGKEFLTLGDTCWHIYRWNDILSLIRRGGQGTSGRISSNGFPAYLMRLPPRTPIILHVQELGGPFDSLLLPPLRASGVQTNFTFCHLPLAIVYFPFLATSVLSTEFWGHRPNSNNRTLLGCINKLWRAAFKLRTKNGKQKGWDQCYRYDLNLL